MDDLKYDEASDVFKATVTVSNTGAMDGKATVQLYGQSPYTEYDAMNGFL